METPRFLKIAYVIGGTLLVLPLFASAYDDKTTHPALTQEIVKLFNSEFKERKISDREAEYIIQGSIDEDTGIRYMRHFYDPVYNKGLTFGKVWMSSKEWAQNTKAQAGFTNSALAGTLKSFFGGEDDYSWDRTIYEYAWGNKKRGLLSLGHILHLLEDATVPDHTRDDPHPPYLHMGSPYEAWTTKFDRNAIYILTTFSGQPVQLSNLNSYFDTLADYSNNYFFSKDSICHNKYNFPNADFEKKEVLSDGKTYFFGYKNFSDKPYRLMARSGSSKWFEEKNKNECSYFLDDNDDLILSDYWSLLSKQAVLHGAGVVKLFFDEVEKEKQTKELFNKNRSWVAKQIDKARGFAGALFWFGGETSTNQGLASLIVANPSVTSEIIEVSPPIADTTEVEPLPQAQHEVRLQTIENSPPQAQSRQQTAEISPPLEEKSRPTPPPALQNQPPSNTSINLPIAGVGGPAPVQAVSVETPVADTTAPNISFSITECNSSLSSDSCLVATTTINLSWSSTATDLDYYQLECTISGIACSGFAISTTTATTTTYTLPTDNSTYVFKAKGRDTTGNESAFQNISVQVTTRPLVINEIAWAGTSSTQDQDEWIELKNNTNKSISLSSWVLYSSTDNAPYISLSGTIAAEGFFVLERTDDTTLASTTANQIYTGALVNTGEVLKLAYASTTTDQTPEISTCNGWCGGSSASGQYWTMERYDPLSTGTSSANWSSWAGFLNNGSNADGAAIKGTPSKRNSINYLITKDAGPLSQNKTLATSSSPYLISNAFTINSGATLTINPGVVIKFLDSTSLTVNGIVDAQGTASDNIIFTSIKDDTYAGDTNQDGSATTPAVGNWNSIKIAGNGSTFDRVIFRYGGYKDTPTATHWANLRIETASTTLKNSIVEYSGAYGAWFKVATGTIDSNIFRNNNVGSDGIGLITTDGSLTIQNNTFQNNTHGLRMLTAGGSHSLSVTSNTFTSNTGEAIDANTVYPTFSGNSFSSNSTNGILYQGVISQNYTFSSGVYKISTGLSVSATTTLTLDAGTIFKFTNSGSMTVQGNLIANGTSANKVVFTSIKDDSFGGDTNNDSSTTTPAKADWSQVHIENATATSTLTHSVFSYGTTGLKLTNSAATLDNILFKTNTTGIKAIGTATTTATSVTFDVNTTDDDPASLIP